VSDNWWVDAGQNRRIKELQGEVDAAYSYAASRSRALQSRLAEVQGTLERRLDRLARSFDAFVELSDVRLQLAVFDREAAVRNRTRRLLAGLSQGAGDPPPLGVDDCPGYWLKPAAEALSALVRGDHTAEEHTAVAGERDKERTALFLTLGLAVAGRHAAAMPWLTDALPALGATVTTTQRQLWLACADGAFGAPGRELVGRRLAEFLDELPAELSERERDRWRSAAASRAGRAPVLDLPGELQTERALTEPPANAARLALLRRLTEKALRTDDVPPSADFTGLLDALIDEGSPDERALVAQARELRQIIEQDGDAPIALDAPAGDTLGLLRGDLFDRDRTGPRAVAARAGGRWIRAIADGLTEKASVRPPAGVDVRVHGHALHIGAAGVTSLTDAEAEIDRAAVISPVVERIGLAVVVAGAAILVLTIVGGLAVLGVLAAAVTVTGAVIAFRERRKRRQATEAAEQDKSRLARQAQEIAAALKESQSRHEERAATATADRQAILTLLT
jgi:hypothetical protein